MTIRNLSNLRDRRSGNYCAQCVLATINISLRLRRHSPTYRQSYQNYVPINSPQILSLQPMDSQQGIMESVHEESVSSPAAIHRLAPEILSMIFEYCLPRRKFITPSDHDAPMLLAQVCGHWRSVAVSTPTLWCSMKFDIGPQHVQSKVPLFITWLERSGAQPLSIHLRNWNDPSPQEISAIIDAANRLENINFHLSNKAWRSLAPIKGRLTRLCKIEVKTTNVESFIGDPFDGFSEAPKLREVAVEFLTNGIILPWSQISCLTINGWQNLRQCLETIRNAISIQTCEFTQCSLYFHPSHDFPPVTLPLRSLRILSEVGSSALLDNLILPDLREIFFLGIWWPHTSFFRMVIRSSCHIERLVLIRVRIASQELFDCLQRLPSLVSLVIETNEKFLGDVVLKRLTYEGEEQPLVPKLRFFGFEDAFEFDDNAFADMVESRWLLQTPSIVARLQFVHLTYCDKVPDPVAISRLEIFRDQGLGLAVKVKGSN
jgi:hypothetical protein